MVNSSPLLHRFGLFVEIASLVLIASGAYVTSGREASANPDIAAAATLPGAGVHLMLGIAVVVLAFFLAGLSWVADRRGPVRLFAALTVLAGVLDGWVATPIRLSAGRAALHASLAPLFFGCAAAVAMLTSSKWNAAQEPVGDRGMHFLRPLAISAPALVLLQMVLGALYRHKLTSVMWHMAGAMVVSLVTLIAAMVVMQQFPEQQKLRRPAIHLISVLLLQVALGVTAFTMQLLETESTVTLAVFTGAHVVVGNLVFGASITFAAVTARYLRRDVAETASV